MEKNGIVWDKERAKRYIRTYGAPDNPKPEYKKRMVFVSQHVTGNSVLDVACGVGHLYPYIAPNVATYKGIDISADMISCARKFFPKGDFEVGDAYNLIGEYEYDTVVSTSLLIHIPLNDVEVVIKQMWHRALKELIFTVPIDRDYSCFLSDVYGESLITHLSLATLNNILDRLNNTEEVKKIPFEEGAFGYKRDFVVVVIKL